MLARRYQARDSPAVFRHLERFPFLHPAQINAEILAKLSDTDALGSVFVHM